MWSKHICCVPYCSSPQTFWHQGPISWKTVLLWRGWDGFRLIQAHCICVLYYYISSVSNHQMLDLGVWELLPYWIWSTGASLDPHLFSQPDFYQCCSTLLPTPPLPLTPPPLVVLEMHSASHIILHQVVIWDCSWKKRIYSCRALRAQLSQPLTTP